MAGLRREKFQRNFTAAKMGDFNSIIKKYVKSIEWLREEFLEMDKILNPVMGIKDWDDSACIKFENKKILASVDGPYTKRLVMKSALIHASTDVVVKGGRPMFALDTLIGNEKDCKEMAGSLKKQALAMQIPILGGNTLFEDTEPRCSLTVFGELLTEEPIRDSGAKKDDLLALIGEPIWGEQEERIEKAKKLFRTWYKILDSKIKIHAAKDVTKGGLISTIYEMEEKSGLEFELDKIPLPLTRNLDNFLISISEKEYEKISEICRKNNCSLLRVGMMR